MDKPLHVRVAEALGCNVEYDRTCGCGYGTGEGGVGYRHGTFGGPDNDSDPTLMRYDTDWSATGPLIEKHALTFWRDEDGSFFCVSDFKPVGSAADSAGYYLYWTAGAKGETRLEAACNLILALSEAGKLETQEVTKA